MVEEFVQAFLVKIFYSSGGSSVSETSRFRVLPPGLQVQTFHCPAKKKKSAKKTLSSQNTQRSMSRFHGWGFHGPFPQIHDVMSEHFCT